MAQQGRESEILGKDLYSFFDRALMNLLSDLPGIVSLFVFQGKRRKSSSQVKVEREHVIRLNYDDLRYLSTDSVWCLRHQIWSSASLLPLPLWSGNLPSSSYIECIPFHTCNKDVRHVFS